MIDVCLNAFKTAIRDINLSASVQKAISVHNSTLSVGTRTYQLNKNVHLVAIGKAAPDMVAGAERVLGEHLLKGIASVPTGVSIPPNLKTQFFTGAEDNLPDEKALMNTIRIEEFISAAKTNNDQQLILFLISGGGSALLPGPISEISLDEKVAFIKLLQRNGADIKQLNTVRTALSRVKGGGLARLGHPAKMISLVVSDIVGDPLELISSGPTVIPEKPPANPNTVLEHLHIADEVPRIADVLKATHLQRTNLTAPSSPVDVYNLIIASNSIFLNEISRQIANASRDIHPFIVTNQLEGDATELGRKFANLIKASLEKGKLSKNELIYGFLNGDQSKFDSEAFQFGQQDGVVLLFGGESTVSFDGAIKTDAKGGRNQELVLSALHQLCSAGEGALSKCRGHFALFSLGSDGQDGPTDAAGAFFSDSDLRENSIPNQSELTMLLDSKSSYLFWSEYKKGRNLVKTGKTGVNVMDVQILAMNFT